MQLMPVILLASCCVSSATRAEFMLQAMPSSPMPPSHSTARLPNSSQEPTERMRRLVASGFGHGVPLRFAVRQLLPNHWRVRYGQGVDPDGLVSWEGGRPWDFVLRDAVKPLGLRAFAAPDEPYVVQITR